MAKYANKAAKGLHEAFIGGAQAGAPDQPLKVACNPSMMPDPSADEMKRRMERNLSDAVVGPSSSDSGGIGREERLEMLQKGAAKGSEQRSLRKSRMDEAGSY